MTVEIDSNGRVPVARLYGEIDLGVSPDVRAALLDALRHHDRLVLDLSGVDYIDSSGVASLVEAYQTARKAGGAIALAAISQPAERVLQLARLDRVFRIHDSVDAATADLAG